MNRLTARQEPDSQPVFKWFGSLPVAEGRVVLSDPAYLHDSGAQVAIDFPSQLAHVGLEYVTLPDIGTVVARLWVSTLPAVCPGEGVVEGELPIEQAMAMVCAPGTLPLWVPQGMSRAFCGRTFIDPQGVHWFCNLHPVPPPAWRGQPFGRFSERIPALGGISMTDAIQGGVVKTHEYAVNADEFSSEGAFATSTQDGAGGFLRHEGREVAFVCRAGLGDGVYFITRHAAPDGQFSVCLDFLGDDE